MAKINLDQIINLKPFSLSKREKQITFNKIISHLNNFHYENCKKYKQIIDSLNLNLKLVKHIEKMPFVPVRLFKDHNLYSVKKREITKVLTSSGTSNKKLSKIYLDKKNSTSQRIVLSKIISNFIGKNKLPMLIIDSKSIFKEKKSFSARVAAILGFSIFGYDHTYVLNDNFSLDFQKLKKFIKKYENKKILVFGFTHLVWENLCKELKRKKISLNLEKAILIHGGGWKKLEKLQISNNEFKNELQQNTKIKKIHNYYGMVEQIGSIFLECEKCGFFVTSNYSEVFIRDQNFKLLKDGQKGIVQLLSLLPTSYPGHNIITEDIGEVAKSNNCLCSSLGKRFKIHGRILNAETRGCSNV